MNMKDFSGKRLLQIPELLQSFPTTVRMNLFVWQTKEKKYFKEVDWKMLTSMQLRNRKQRFDKVALLAT